MATATNYDKILAQLNQKLNRQEQSVEETRQHIEAIKALQGKAK